MRSFTQQSLLIGPMSVLPQFERLALPHLDSAYNLAFWLVRSRPDAEDIVQEALLRAFRSFGGFRGGDFRPWLLAIVRNVAYRWLSNRKRAGNVVSLEEVWSGNQASEARIEQIASEEPSAEDRLIGAVEQDYLARAMAQLPPAFREVIVLREIEGLAYRAIAEVTGAPIGTVMSRLSRGRNELRKALKRVVDEDEVNAV